MWIVAGVVLAAFATRAAAQNPAPTADQVKAVYLHKFPGYVEWPAKSFPDPGTPFVIGIVGADAVYAELARLLVGRTMQGRPVELHHLSRIDPPRELHMLYVGQDVGAEASAGIIAAYKGKPVLTVSDLPRGLEAGAALNFLEADKRVRFEAAPAVAEQAGLHLSSRLLAVAEHVSGGPP